MAARSPARSSAGPLVMRRPTSISAATIPDRVVLPSPGGPAKSRWSAAWPRPRGGEQDLEVLLQPRLADELVEAARPEAGLLGRLDRVGRLAQQLVSHRRAAASDFNASRRRSSTAPSPAPSTAASASRTSSGP